MFSRIWAWILALLASIIPWLDKPPAIDDWRKSTIEIIEAMKISDIDTIESYMNQDIKDNVPDLHKKIEAFINAIEGEITSYTSPKQVTSSWIGSRQKKGVSASIETTERTYGLGIHWVTNNPSAPEEVGIIIMRLTVKTDNGFEEFGVEDIRTI